MEIREPTKICKYCRSEIPKNAKVCPHCQKKQKSAGKTILYFLLSFIIFIIAIILVLFIFFAAIGFSDSEQSANTTQTTIDEKPDNSVSEEDFKASCEEFNYRTVARNPKEYEGNNYVFTCEVFDSDTTLGITTYKVELPDEDGDFYGDMIFVTDMREDKSTNILDGDQIRVWGTFDGMAKTSNALTGASGEEVEIYMKYYELLDE